VDAAAQEREARSRGWRPKDQFRGKPEEWVDAGTFMDRVQQVMPILKSELRRTTAELEETRGATALLTRRLEEQSKEIDALKASGAAQDIEQQRETLVAGILDARSREDARSEIILSAKLAALENRPAAPPPKKEEPAPTEARADPTFKAWADENPWWTDDPIKRATATGIAQKLAADGRLTGMTPRERLDMIASETEKYLGARVTRQPGKVNGTRPSGGGGGSQGSDKGWDGLPPQAKAQAMRQASKFKLVGEGRAFKTAADWQKFYAQDYNKAGIPVQIVEVSDNG
jgi:hypothetical protein